MSLRDQILAMLNHDESERYDEGIQGSNVTIRDIIELIDETSKPRTVDELAKQTYPGDTFDTALPQTWVHNMRERGFDVRGHFVTLYPSEGVAYMAPITDQGIRMAAVVASTV